MGNYPSHEIQRHREHRLSRHSRLPSNRTGAFVFGLYRKLGMRQRHTMHTSLQPTTNMRFLVLWCAISVVASLVASPTPWLALVAGCVQGIFAGFLQLYALRETPALFLKTRRLMDVTDALNSSRYGRFYYYVFYSQVALQLILSLFPFRERALVTLSLLAGYSAFSFMRDLVSLRGTFELQRLSKAP
jgi:hypothetical protein